MDAARWWLTMGLLLALAGCSGMVGAYRGPEPFGGKQYSIAPARVELTSEVLVVLLMLADERPAIEHDLDWVRQAKSFGDTLGQPLEVRNEFDRAIKAGLSVSRGIRLVSPETFLKTRDADLVISGRILRCEVEKKIGWTTVDFHGRAAIEITLRNGQGKVLLAAPLSFSTDAKVPWHPPTLQSQADEIPLGVVASAVEKAIRQVVESFLSSRQLADVLKAVPKADRNMPDM